VATEALSYRDAGRGPREGRGGDDGPGDGGAARPRVQVELHVHGKNPVSDLAAARSELRNVEAVVASDVNAIDE
jgi:hypothetical protein